MKILRFLHNKSTHQLTSLFILIPVMLLTVAALTQPQRFIQFAQTASESAFYTTPPLFGCLQVGEGTNQTCSSKLGVTDGYSLTLHGRPLEENHVVYYGDRLVGSFLFANVGDLPIPVKSIGLGGESKDKKSVLDFTPKTGSLTINPKEKVTITNASYIFETSDPIGEWTVGTRVIGEEGRIDTDTKSVTITVNSTCTGLRSQQLSDKDKKNIQTLCSKDPDNKLCKSKQYCEIFKGGTCPQPQLSKEVPLQQCDPYIILDKAEQDILEELCKAYPDTDACKDFCDRTIESKICPPRIVLIDAVTGEILSGPKTQTEVLASTNTTLTGQQEALLAGAPGSCVNGGAGFKSCGAAPPPTQPKSTVGKPAVRPAPPPAPKGGVKAKVVPAPAPKAIGKLIGSIGARGNAKGVAPVAPPSVPPPPPPPIEKILSRADLGMTQKQNKSGSWCNWLVGVLLNGICMPLPQREIPVPQFDDDENQDTNSRFNDYQEAYGGIPKGPTSGLCAEGQYNRDGKCFDLKTGKEIPGGNPPPVVPGRGTGWEDLKCDNYSVSVCNSCVLGYKKHSSGLCIPSGGFGSPAPAPKPFIEVPDPNPDDDNAAPPPGYKKVIDGPIKETPTSCRGLSGPKTCNWFNNACYCGPAGSKEEPVPAPGTGDNNETPPTQQQPLPQPKTIKVLNPKPRVPGQAPQQPPKASQPQPQPLPDTNPAPDSVRSPQPGNTSNIVYPEVEFRELNDTNESKETQYTNRLKKLEDQQTICKDQNQLTDVQCEQQFNDNVWKLQINFGYFKDQTNDANNPELACIQLCTEQPNSKATTCQNNCNNNISCRNTCTNTRDTETRQCEETCRN